MEGIQVDSMEIVAILNDFTNNVVGAVILAVLAVATVVTVLDWCGFLPIFISRFVFKNRVDEIKSILSEMGVDFREQKKKRFFYKLSSFFKSDDEIGDQVKEIISRHLKTGGFEVGKTKSFKVDEYADLMSGSCDPRDAELIARCLSTYLRLNYASFSSADFDFVVTPKSGSPFIGYEFSKLISKPLVLHDCNEVKYRSSSDKLNAISRFDCAVEIKSGMVGLVVDDSTTGGRKVNSLVNDLRNLGCVVSDCLVVFEPQGKNGSNLLSTNGVRLHSIIKR